jgi:hypothetical protein
MTARSWTRRPFARTPRTGAMSASRRLRRRPTLEALEDRVVPSTFTVNSTGDSGTGSGFTGDLRYCITQANAASGRNTIDFNFTTPATIRLNSPLPTIEDNLTIDGPGANLLTIDGQGTTNILTTGSASQVVRHTVAISGLTLANGSANAIGGANFGGAVANLYGDALKMTDCTLSGNSASDGGGAIFNDASTLKLIGCTLSGNSAGLEGGGIDNVLGGSLTMIDCTVAGNSAGDGGGVISLGPLTVVSCTIADNTARDSGGGGGGGLYTAAAAAVYNTIVANNSGGDLVNITHGALTGSNNLVTDLIQEGSGGPTGTITGNPLLAPLASYGGPTQTMALFAGSPAIGAADPTLSIPGLTLPGTDQRGFDRVVNNLEDIGAFQTQGGQGVTPTVAIAAPQIAIAQAVVTFTFTATDPTTADQAGAFAYLIDWNGDGSDLQIVQGSSSVQVTHAYAAAGSYTPTVTALDQDGHSSLPTAVASPFVVAALDGSSLDKTIESLGSVTLQVSDVTQENAAFAAINSLPPTPGTGTGVAITVAPGTYTDAKVNTSSGAQVNVQGSTPQQWSRVQNTTELSGVDAPNIVGGSPAVEVDQGTVTVSGMKLTTPTDAPTILVTGGTLVLQDDVVLGTPNGDQPVIEVDGGTLILGPQIGADGNKLAAYGAAQFVHVTGSGRVIDLGGNAYDQVASDGTFTPVPGQLTLTQLSSSVPAPVYGQSVTFTATVSDPSGGMPTGSVEFYDGSTDLGPGSALSGTGGAASSRLSITTLTAGPHTIRAVYTPTGTFQATNDTLNQTVNQATPTVSVADAGGTYNGQPFPATATAAGVDGQPAASLEGVTPTVTYYAGSGPGGTPLAGAPSTAGTYTAVASFAGSPDYTSASAQTTFTINPAAATTAAGNASALFSPLVQDVTLTATVSSSAGPVNEGTVTFTVKQGGTVIGAATTSGTVSNGAAGVSYALPAGTAAGTYTVDAVYNPGPDFSGSPDAAHTLTVVSDSITAPAGLPVSASERSPLTNVPVATFHAAGPASLFTATIAWGDGTTTAGTVTLTGGGAYAVSGSHTYLDEGPFAVAVTITGPANSAPVGTTAAVLEELLPGGVRGTANQRFVSEVYRDLLGRAVEPAGLATWAGMLDQGVSRAQVVSLIEAAPPHEFFHVEVAAAYRRYLGRAPDAGGLAAFTDLLASGGTVEQVDALLAASAEYAQRAGGTEAKFLAQFYQDTFGRAIDPAGQQTWGQALAGGMTRQQVAALILGSREYEIDLVEGSYLSLLGRPFGPGDGDPATRFPAGTRDEAMILALAGSAEYFARTAP